MKTNILTCSIKSQKIVLLDYINVIKSICKIHVIVTT